MNGHMLLSLGLGEDFQLYHLRTNVHASNQAKGAVSLRLLWMAFQLWLQLLVALFRHRPQIVYLYLSQNKTGFLRDAMIILSARALRAQVVAHMRGGNFAQFYRQATPIWQRFIARVVQQLSGVIVLAQRLRSQFVNILPDQHIYVLYNAVTPEFLTIDPSARTKHEQTFTVFFLGHLAPAKGFFDLLKAISAVLEAIPEATFACAGEWLIAENNILVDECGRQLHFDGTEMQTLWKNLQQRYGQRVHYLGLISGEEKLNAFRAADVFVLPSYSEGFPMSVLEAMAASLPLVTTPVGALAEILQEERNGVFVAPGDVQALSEALIKMAEQPEKRRQMGQTNRQAVESLFSPHTINAGLGQILKDCLHPLPSPSPLNTH